MSWKVLGGQPGGTEGQKLSELHPQGSSKAWRHIHSSGETEIENIWPGREKTPRQNERIRTTDTLRMVIPDPASPWIRQVKIALGSGSPWGQDCFGVRIAMRSGLIWGQDCFRFLSQTFTEVWMWKRSPGTPKILCEKVLGLCWQELFLVCRTLQYVLTLKNAKYTHKSQSLYKLFTLCTVMYFVLTHLQKWVC